MGNQPEVLKLKYVENSHQILKKSYTNFLLSLVHIIAVVYGTRYFEHQQKAKMCVTKLQYVVV